VGRMGLWISGAAIVALVAVPIVGLVFAYLQPPGLVEPPPLDWGAVGWMTVRTLGLAAAVSCLSLLLGTTLAFLDRRMQYPGRVLLGVLCIVPVAIPSYLLAAIIRESFAPLGPLGELLGLQGTFSGMGPAIFVLTLSCTPYVHFLVSAALADFPAAEDEAAVGAVLGRHVEAAGLLPLRAEARVDDLDGGHDAGARASDALGLCMYSSCWSAAAPLARVASARALVVAPRQSRRAAAGVDGRPAGVVAVVLSGASASGPSLRGMYVVLAVSQHVIGHGARVLLLTSGTLAVCADASRGAAGCVAG